MGLIYARIDTGHAPDTYQGKRPKIIRSLLRHNSITLTMGTHSHLLDDVDDDEVGGLD